MATNEAPTKREVTKNGKQRWEVDYGMDDAGHRLRPLFRTEAAADAEIDRHHDEMRRCGDYWARLSKLKRNLIVATLQSIEAAGLTVDRVWANHQQWSKEINKQSTTEPMPYVDVVAEFRKRKLAAGTGERYVDEVETLFLKFGEGRLQQAVHEILPADLEKWLDSHADWSLSTRRTNQLRFSSLWAVAVAKGWCVLNIVDRLNPVHVPAPPVKVYTNDTTLHIMAAAMSNETTQQVIAPLALGFFGCMRPEEIDSSKALKAGLPAEKLFGWHDIDLKHRLCTVRPEIAKTGDQRTIRLQPVCVEWLKLAKELKNPLPPVNERRLVDQCCALIDLDEWLRDGLRKSCCTHLRAVYKNDYDVIRDCGNSIRVLLTHYADLQVPESVSLEHWQISTEKVNAYLKTNKWKKVVEEAAKAAAAKATASSGVQPKP